MGVEPQGSRVHPVATLTQAADAFRLNVEVGITVAGAPVRIERVAMTGKQATLTFDAPAEPSAVTLDPDTWALFESGPVARLP